MPVSNERWPAALAGPDHPQCRLVSAAVCQGQLAKKKRLAKKKPRERGAAGHEVAAWSDRVLPLPTVR